MCTIPLHCVLSRHSTTTYHWEKLGETEKLFPSTPVIYVNEAGLFQCKVESGGMEEESSVIALQVQPGRKTQYFKTQSPQLNVAIYMIFPIIGIGRP